ncbi:MAG: FkbM family methyltransferase [Urechidicola sp.]|nr:FkbM family methyltransferase [Urechidicola sp.]
MRIILAKIWKIFFKINFIKSKYFGLHKKVFKPLNLFKGVILKVEFNGFFLVLHLDDWIQENIFFLGEYEKAELKTLNYFLNQNSVFVDLGANFGLYTLYASKLIGMDGKVISFEPFKKNYKALTNNIAINNFNNIQSENIAVGEREGEINLYYDSSEMNLGMASTKFIENSYREKATIITLDSYFSDKSISRIDFVKIDIEGHEYKALLGMKNLLLRHHPTLLIEILREEELPNNEDKVIRFLSSLGYIKYFINDNGSISLKQNNLKRQNYIFSTKKNIEIID